MLVRKRGIKQDDKSEKLVFEEMVHLLKEDDVDIELRNALAEIASSAVTLGERKAAAAMYEMAGGGGMFEPSVSERQRGEDKVATPWPPPKGARK